MRGEASRVADRESRDSFAAKLRASGDDAWQIGDELFGITCTLDHNPRLQRALTDPGRPVADKVKLLNELIGGKVQPMRLPKQIARDPLHGGAFINHKLGFL